MAGFVVALTRMVGWPCFCTGSVLCCWLGFGFGSDAIYYLERHRLGGEYTRLLKDWIVVSLLLLPCCSVRCACVCVCVWLTCSCCLAFFFARPSIHSSLSTAYETHIAWGADPIPSQSTSTNPPSWTCWMLLFTAGGGENEQASEPC